MNNNPWKSAFIALVYVIYCIICACICSILPEEMIYVFGFMAGFFGSIILDFRK